LCLDKKGETIGTYAIIFAAVVLVVLIAVPVFMGDMLANYPVGTGYKAFNSWNNFMDTLGWFYYVIAIFAAVVAYATGLKMGIGKIFMGVALIVGWIVVKFGIIENKSGLSAFIADPAQRFALVEAFHGVEPVVWILVLMAGFGIIIWGSQSY
jgi:hypothetical protein